jgi:Fe2+ transport system protein B
MKKRCCRCKRLLNISCFAKNSYNKDGLQNLCRKCHKEYYEEHREEIKKKRKIYWKIYYQKNKKKIIEKIKKYCKLHKQEKKKYIQKYNEINKERIRKQKKEYRKRRQKERREYNKKYYQSHKKERREYERNRRKKDTNYKIACYIRTRTYNVLRGKGIKCAHMWELFGLDHLPLKERQEFLANHLQRTADKRYPNVHFNIHNFSGKKWHIDHKRPCSSFNLKKKSEQRICFHWKNLQILTAEDNMKKHNKLKYKILKRKKLNVSRK